jgi:hypothetical protein
MGMNADGFWQAMSGRIVHKDAHFPNIKYLWIKPITQAQAALIER